MGFELSLAISLTKLQFFNEIRGGRKRISWGFFRVDRRFLSGVIRGGGA